MTDYITDFTDAELWQKYEIVPDDTIWDVLLRIEAKIDALTAPKGYSEPRLKREMSGLGMNTEDYLTIPATDRCTGCALDHSTHRYCRCFNAFFGDCIDLEHIYILK